MRTTQQEMWEDRSVEQVWRLVTGTGVETGHWHMCGDRSVGQVKGSQWQRCGGRCEDASSRQVRGEVSGTGVSGRGVGLGQPDKY